MKRLYEKLRYKTTRYIKNKLMYLDNRYIKTLSTKKLVVVLMILAVLNSPLIPGGFAASPLVTKFC